jgi:hypothetical protein
MAMGFVEKDVIESEGQVREATEKLEQFLPPHPGPLPWGEGEILSRFSNSSVTSGPMQRTVIRYFATERR